MVMSPMRKPKHSRVDTLFFFALFLSTLQLPAATTTWATTSLGPYKSTDGGTTWQPVKISVSNALLQGVPDTVAIALDPGDPNKVYVLGVVTGTSAVFKSTDGGQTWSAVLLPGISVGSGNQSVYWMGIDPAVTSTIYIEAANKVLRSTDSGGTWVELSSIAGIAGVSGSRALAVDPIKSGVVYVTTSATVNKSTDFGNTWTSVKLNLNQSPTIQGIFIDPLNSQRLYVARINGQGCVDTSRQAVDCNFFKSVDAGQTWTRVAVPGAGRSIAFDRVSGDIYAGGNETGVGSTVLKSSDQGVTWTPLLKAAGGINDGPWVSADPLVAGNVYSVGDSITGGLVQKTTDGGATWKKVTFPPYCTGPVSTACPSALQQTPSVTAMTYVLPPRPTASVSGMVSAASRQSGSVASESIVIANGSHLATGSATGDLDQPSMTLAGTTINVTDSAGATRPALLFGVSDTQVTYQIPAGTAAGAATVTITAADGVSATAQLQIAAVAPGFYSINGSGLAKGYAVRMSNGNLFVEDLFDIDSTGALVARPVTVSNGDSVMLILYGTGFRAAGADVSATIGAVNAPVLYAGPQGVQPGLDQLNLTIPPEAAAGGLQSLPLVVTAAGQTANTVFVTVQ
jgi:uncharacterized protein (TIGR03437 family)